MASKSEHYRHILRNLDDWDEYLLQESGLPGPRGNLELAQVVADEGSLELFQRWLEHTPGKAPVNSPYEFLAFCGAVGLGRLLADGEFDHLQTLRSLASDPRWRMREAVAMALQRLGEVDMERLQAEMEGWSRGTNFEQRAAAAALCEPRLLEQSNIAQSVLEILMRSPLPSISAKTGGTKGLSPYAKAWATAGAWRLRPCPNMASRS
jgi:hypothetical protein